MLLHWAMSSCFSRYVMPSKCQENANNDGEVYFGAHDYFYDYWLYEQREGEFDWSSHSVSLRIEKNKILLKWKEKFLVTVKDINCRVKRKWKVVEWKVNKKDSTRFML